MKSELETREPRSDFTTTYLMYAVFLFQRTHGLFGLGPRRWALPVVMSEHGAVTVAEVQTPDLHVPVGGASGDDRAVLVNTRSETMSRDCGSTSLYFRQGQLVLAGIKVLWCIWVFRDIKRYDFQYSMTVVSAVFKSIGDAWETN